jgi:hypothetical protein
MVGFPEQPFERERRISRFDKLKERFSIAYEPRDSPAWECLGLHWARDHDTIVFAEMLAGRFNPFHFVAQMV